MARRRIDVLLGLCAATALAGCGGAQWRPRSVEAYRPAFEQASRGDAAAVAVALRRDPRLVRAREEDGLTLLHDAAAEGRLDVASLLIDRGARVDARTDGGLTPLHLAAQNDLLPMVLLLVRRGAGVNAADRRGRTPLDLAARRGHADVASWLAAHGGRPGRPG